MRTSVAFVLLGLACLSCASPSNDVRAGPTSPAPALHQVTRPEQTGKLSRAVLLRSWRLDEATAAKRQAPSGLGFEFLVIRAPGSSGQFTLSELRDATIQGSSYRELTRSALGNPIEPHTEILNTRDVRVDSQRATDAFGITDDNSIVMRTLLYGAVLPESGQATVIVDVGWNKQTEKLEFSVDLARLQAAPASL